MKSADSPTTIKRRLPAGASFASFLQLSLPWICCYRRSRRWDMDRSEAFHHIPQIVEPGQGLLGDPVRNAEQGFGNPAGDAGQRIGVAADGDGIAKSVLEISGFQGTDDGWRHCPPAGNIERVPRLYAVDGLTEVVSE